MKNIKYSLFIALMGLAFVACNSGQSNENTTSEENVEMHEGHDHMESDAQDQDKSGPEYTSKYICPMHCEGSGSDEPGKCPVCGMDYKLNEEG